MRRPFLLRVLPDRLKLSVWARLYRGKAMGMTSLYHDAGLKYAPGVKMELVPGDLISDCIAFTGIYELALTRRIMELARSGGTFIDDGANLGYFALLWVSANPKNRCIAFEPSPRNIETLKRNIISNGFDAQVELVPVAAGKERGKMQFDPGPDNQTGWGGFAPAGRTGIEVDVQRIDEIVAGNGSIALMKVDTEGADAWALMGCDQLFKSRSVGEIWFEQNKPRARELGIEIDAAQEYLRSVGYAPRPLGDEALDLVEWYAVPTPNSNCI